MQFEIEGVIFFGSEDSAPLDSSRIEIVILFTMSSRQMAYQLTAPDQAEFLANRLMSRAIVSMRSLKTPCPR
jgi:hypothetical protein